MAFIIIFFWRISYHIQASNLVHYKFGSNFGQIFFDYSGSGNHGQNGISINSDSYDTIPFDRGAYFHTESTYVRLPPNQVKTSPHYWMNSFSIIMWTYFKEVGYDYYVFISRFNDTEWCYIIRKFDYDRFHTSFYNRGTLTNLYSSVYNTASPGKWICISMIVDNLIVKCYSNEILFANFNLPLNYIETNANYHLIGSNNKSLIGFVWSFYLYDEAVLPTNFYSTSYTGSNCVSTGCPSSCSPAIKENGQNYCISTSDYTSCSGCSYGCKNGICLNCENSFTKSCTVESNEIYHICPESTSSSPCNCVNGYYLINNYYTCKSCYGECSTCNSAFQCSTCKDGNSEVHSDIGCYCKQGFYNTSALISSGVCIKCHSDCLECRMKNICISCKSDYSTPHATTGCVCIPGYYNTTNLSQSSSCLKCYSTCKSCNDFQKCLTCTPSNSSPRSDFGCQCNQGYYNSTSLETGGICLKCHSDCEICDKDLLCLTCKDIYSQPDNISGCACKQGFYNTSEFISISYCKPCFLECKTCASEFICNECVDSNTMIILTGGCLCKDGFYNTSQVVSQGSCLECHNECKTCNESFKCLTCLDANSIVSPQSGCNCIEKYYKDSNSSCQKCQSDCQICRNSNSCEICVDINANFNGTQCFCKSGYYNSSINSQLVCEKCPVNCSDCLSSKNCINCSFYNMSRHNGICECPSNSTLKGNSCIADTGFYISSYPDTDFTTFPCDPTCETCFDFGSNKCIKCANNIKYEQGKCEGCNKNEFFDRKSSRCLNCSEDCKTCLNFSHCLSCTIPSFNLIEGQCLNPCTLFEYFNEGHCKACPPLCKKCDPICKICVENSKLVNDSFCQCSKGFKPTDRSCIEKNFIASLSIKSINLAEILFSEHLEKLLKSVDYEFLLPNRSDFKATLIKNDSQKSIFSLIFKKEVKKGTEIQVKILQKKVFSVNNSQLANHLLTSSLPSYVPESSLIQVVFESTKAMAKVAVSSSIGASLLSNPSAAWALLNSIQMVVFLPLNSNEMTPNVKTFLCGFSGYNILPNVLASFFNEQASSEPYLEARKYGIQSSVFLVNTGKSFLIVVAGFIIWPFVFAISKVTKGKIERKSVKILENFRFSFFLRFWIQAYLEVFIFGVVQLRSRVIMAVEGHFNYFFAALASLVGVLTLPSIFLFFYFSSEKIENCSEKFKKKWGSLFLEFKNNKGFWSTQFYFFYFLRRLAFAFSQIYLNSLLFVQGALNIMFSFVTLSFILYFRPFKETSVLVSNIVGEISITLIMILTYLFLWDFSRSDKELIEMMVIFTVLLGMFIQVIISIFVFAKSVHILWKKFEKIRSLEFVRRFERVPQLRVSQLEIPRLD